MPMQTHAFSRKDAKRFADRVLKRLERDGTAVTYPQILEAIAAGFELRDWNTLSAALHDDSAAGSDTPKTRQKRGSGSIQGEIHEWKLSTETSFATSGSTSPFHGAVPGGGSVELVIAPSGRGKSVLLGVASLEYCMGRHHQGPVPRLCVIDIGPGSAGTVALLQDLLPEARKHEVVYRRLRMTPDSAINVFDTPLGQRIPDQAQVTLLRNLLALLLMDGSSRQTSVGQAAAEADICAMALDVCSRWWSDAGPLARPARYVAGLSAAIDAALAQSGRPTPRTWWQAVDILFEAGDFRHAELAQRQAVPTIADVIEALGSTQVRQAFGHEKAADDGGELIASVHRRIANWLRGYPNLALRTGSGLDLGEARVAVLDLDEVAPTAGGFHAVQQTAISYLMARHAAAGLGFRGLDGRGMAQPYLDYHRKRRDGTGCVRMVFAEIHRVASLKPMADQLLSDAREARGLGISLVLASQTHTGLREVADIADTIWFGGVGRQEDVEELGRQYQLSASALRTIGQDLKGPTPQGSRFLAVRNEGSRKEEQLHVIRLGPQELWALATGAEDIALRKTLYRRIGGSEARRRLAACFPGGSAKAEIQRRIVWRIGEKLPFLHDASIIEGLATEIAGRSSEPV